MCTTTTFECLKFHLLLVFRLCHNNLMIEQNIQNNKRKHTPKKKKRHRGNKCDSTPIVCKVLNTTVAETTTKKTRLSASRSRSLSRDGCVTIHTESWYLLFRMFIVYIAEMRWLLLLVVCVYCFCVLVMLLVFFVWGVFPMTKRRSFRSCLVSKVNVYENCSSNTLIRITI